MSEKENTMLTVAHQMS